MSSPAVLEIDGNADELNEVAALGYLVFTDVEAVRKHAKDLSPHPAS